MEYDPTNGLIAGENLIRVAVTRDPSQAVPISGTFDGTLGQFIGMTVEVTVNASSTPPRQRVAGRIDSDSPPTQALPPGQAVQTESQSAPAMETAQQAQSQNAQLIGTVQPMQNAEPGHTDQHVDVRRPSAA
ncbi:MAG: hypothetical protein WDN48_18195 [Pseudolabrys sp.]